MHDVIYAFFFKKKKIILFIDVCRNKSPTGVMFHFVQYLTHNNVCFMEQLVFMEPS